LFVFDDDDDDDDDQKVAAFFVSKRSHAKNERERIRLFFFVFLIHPLAMQLFVTVLK